VSFGNETYKLDLTHLNYKYDIHMWGLTCIYTHCFMDIIFFYFYYSMV
jgi:hypothetical protein